MTLFVLDSTSIAMIKNVRKWRIGGLFFSLILGVFPLWAGEWVSGPMLGYRAHREALIWVETRDAESIQLNYWQAGDKSTFKTLEVQNPAVTPAGVQPVKFVLPLLEMGTSYQYEIYLDGERQRFPYALEFSTTDQWEWRQNDSPPELSFLFGSCSYINDAPYDRPGEPYGQNPAIFETMAEMDADFMIWGGDNIYLRESDFSSYSGIWYRFSKNRSTPEFQELLARMPHYAIWDDHDYSSNDGNKSFEFKGATTEAFQAYWGNPTWGLPDLPGVFGKFHQSDAAFILMDNRTYRDDSNWDPETHPEKTQYGPDQLDWLKQSLLHIADHKTYDGKPLYPFRFIVTGNQFLSTAAASPDNHINYPSDYEEILRFIEEEEIQGVVFLTGDVHHTSLHRIILGNGQQIYDLTSSALSSGPWRDVADSFKAQDSALVEGTLVGDNNFCRVSLSGPAGDREIHIESRDAEGNLNWEYTIPQDELGY